MTHPAAWTEAQTVAYTLRAEVRAIEEGHRAWLIPDVGDPRYRVVSHDEPDVSYYLRVTPGRPLRVSCTCPSGEHRTDLPIPCKHAALVARRLEREGAAIWADGLWQYAAPDVYDPRIDDHPEDPFEGLAPEA